MSHIEGNRLVNKKGPSPPLYNQLFFIFLLILLTFNARIPLLFLTERWKHFIDQSEVDTADGDKSCKVDTPYL